MDENQYDENTLDESESNESISDTDEICLDDEDYSYGTSVYVEKLRWYKDAPNELVSREKQRKIVKSFVAKFSQECPSSDLYFYEGSLKEAVTQSIDHQNETKPLILYLHHCQSIGRCIFYEEILNSSLITDFLETNFVVWPWDRTYSENYHHFLQLLSIEFGSEIPFQLAILNNQNDLYPMLVPLVKHNGHVMMNNIISNAMTNQTQMMNILFDTATPLNREGNAALRPIWLLIQEDAEEKCPEEIINQLNSITGELINIKSLFNQEDHSTCPPEWTQPIRKLDESLLFLGCSRAFASEIISDGFRRCFAPTDDDPPSRPIDFSNPVDYNERTVLICRIREKKILGPLLFCLGSEQISNRIEFFDQITPIYQVFYLK